ncbi:hypothetical protein [Symmachiella dynata]|uniref:hypothetical protein n=1 Tax=Symmachiella dynata TaxID=2527995 RepID=UPI0030EBB8A1
MRNTKRNQQNSRRVNQSIRAARRKVHKPDAKITIGVQMRGNRCGRGAEAFNAPEIWHEPTGRESTRYIVHPAGKGYVHPVTPDEVAARLELLPAEFTEGLEVVQFSRMTRKRSLFPCYGMQWGVAIYLYPIDETLEEAYVRPPTPQQRIETEMHGGVWSPDGNLWRLSWTEAAIKDFYLNNILIHELGHHNDHRNTNFEARERYANWFAIEHGYRASRELRD